MATQHMGVLMPIKPVRLMHHLTPFFVALVLCIAAVRWWQISGISVFHWWKSFEPFFWWLPVMLLKWSDALCCHSGLTWWDKQNVKCFKALNFIKYIYCRVICMYCVLSSFPCSFHLRPTRRRRHASSLRMKRTSRPSPACVWLVQTPVFSAFVRRKQRRLQSRMWRRRSNLALGLCRIKCTKDLCVMIYLILKDQDFGRSSILHLTWWFFLGWIMANNVGLKFSLALSGFDKESPKQMLM